ncbi:MAG: septal ring lytic transglycosylase RlpA family protein [Candidatus Aminicenantes bacterium]|nr:septal ring lytic transglycosylase RlpA family protein [Candidatus Aminicenantes bacterium]
MKHLTGRAASAALCILIPFALFLSCIPKPSALPANVLTGTASWYGPDFHGKPTSNREIYNMYDLTAAHKSLPFGTGVMVTNLLNGKTVQVRINDRGPFVGDRIIDLSYAAARLLDLVGPGTARVRLDILDQSSPPASSFRFSVQIGAFTVRDNAEQQVQELAALQGLPRAVLSEYRTESQVYYRVRVPAASLAEAQAIAQKLAEARFQVIILEE